MYLTGQQAAGRPNTQPPGDDARPCCVKGALFILFVSLSSSLPLRLSRTAFRKRNEFAEKGKKRKVFTVQMQ